MDADVLLKLKDKYTGETALRYEQKRRDTEHWRKEQTIVKNLVESCGLPEGSTVLDVPVGTGRFLPVYEKQGYRAIGLDASEDMLAEASQKAGELSYDDVRLQKGDITDISLDADEVDLAVCIRLMNWFDFSTFQRAMKELVRVSSQFVIVGVRMTGGWERIPFRSWLDQALHNWKQDLKASAKQLIRPSGRRDRQDGTHGEQVPLIDHPEPEVRDEFKRQDLTVVEERHAILFKEEPRLRGLGTVRKLPYHIFLLRV